MGLLYECDRCKALMKPDAEMILIEFTTIESDDKRVIGGPKKTNYCLCPKCGCALENNIKEYYSATHFLK